MKVRKIKLVGPHTIRLGIMVDNIFVDFGTFNRAKPGDDYVKLEDFIELCEEYFNNNDVMESILNNFVDTFAPQTHQEIYIYEQAKKILGY